MTGCGNPYSVNNRYTWGATTSSGFDGTAKTLFLDSLNTNSFGGHNDWRLPTLAELVDIALAGYNPTINPIFNGTTNGTSYSTRSDPYWSSDTNTSNSSQAKRLDFGNSSINNASKTSNNFVRAVRGPYPTPTPS